jgi:hypothetical protein
MNDCIVLNPKGCQSAYELTAAEVSEVSGGYVEIVASFMAVCGGAYALGYYLGSKVGGALLD